MGFSRLVGDSGGLGCIVPACGTRACNKNSSGKNLGCRNPNIARIYDSEYAAPRPGPNIFIPQTKGLAALRSFPQTLNGRVPTLGGTVQSYPL